MSQILTEDGGQTVEGIHSDVQLAGWGRRIEQLLESRESKLAGLEGIILTVCRLVGSQ